MWKKEDYKSRILIVNSFVVVVVLCMVLDIWLVGEYNLYMIMMATMTATTCQSTTTNGGNNPAPELNNTIMMTTTTTTTNTAASITTNNLSSITNGLLTINLNQQPTPATNGTNVNGTSGGVSATTASNVVLVAKFDYKAKETHELDLKKNERLLLLDNTKNWWFVKRMDSEQTGYVVLFNIFRWRYLTQTQSFKFTPI